MNHTHFRTEHEFDANAFECDLKFKLQRFKFFNGCKLQLNFIFTLNIKKKESKMEFKIGSSLSKK